MASNGPPASKKPKLDALTDSSDVSEIGNDKETDALEAIDMIHTDIDRLNEKASEEILEVEKKYKKLKQPHFDKRQEVIEQIPNFWTKTLLNHPQIFSVANEKEKECLQYLKKVVVEDFEDMKSGYTLSFCFKANPYFSNELLCKEFQLDSRDDSEAKSKSTEIDWKDGMDLVKHAKTLPRAPNRRRGLQCSFFAWFIDNEEPSLDSIAESIKEDMWPNPLTYYLSSELSDVDENSMGDSDEEDELDESVVVVEDDDDEDEDEEVYEVEDDDDEEELDTTGDVEVIEEEDLIEDKVDEKVEKIGDSKGEDEIDKTKGDKKTDKSKASDKSDKSKASDKNDNSKKDDKTDGSKGDDKTDKSEKDKDGVSSKEKGTGGDEGKKSKDVGGENQETSTSSSTNG